MANIPSSVKSLSSDNTKDDFIQAARIILKYADKIISNPNEEKFRKIRLGNPTVESKLLPVVGALECFFDMGFIEVNYIFTYVDSGRHESSYTFLLLSIHINETLPG